MASEEWQAVDRYFEDLLLPADPALAAALQESDAAGLPAISVSPAHGKLLMMLAMLTDAKRILEIGTLGGYSTIWLARGLSAGGKVISLEIDPHHAEVARRNVERAGLGGRVEIRVGRALDTLPKLAAEKAGPVDLAFIDADKGGNAEYLAWALKMSRKGSVIVIDNVVRNGAVADPKSRDGSVLGSRKVTEMIAAEPRLAATAIQTVGSKGYDGFAIAIVVS
ncbi:O-methyltransferase [soil metagenome]